MLILTSCGSAKNFSEVKEENIAQTTYVSLQDAIIPEVSEIDSTESESKYAFVYPSINYLVDKETENVLENNYTEIDVNGKLYPYSYYYFKDDEVLSKAYLLLYNSIYDMKETIEFNDIKISLDDLNKVLFVMLYDNPDFYYVQGNGAWKVLLDDTIETQNLNLGFVPVLNIKLNYLYNRETVDTFNKSMNDAFIEIEQHIPKDLSRYDLYVWLHDFVIQNIEYETDPLARHNDVLAGLIDRYGMCNAFAMTYNYLCRNLGITTACVRGDAGASHIWNAVPYEGSWMFVDCTMDNIDSSANNWCKHGTFGYSEDYLQNVLKYSIFTEDDGLEFCPYPKCDNSELLYKDKCGYNYTIDSEDCLQKIEDLLVTNINIYGKSYIEVFVSDENVYSNIKDNILNTNNKEFFDMLENVKNRVTGCVVDLQQVGLSSEDWNKSFILYVFTEKVKDEF